MFILLYAEDCMLLPETRDGLQQGLDILHDYCKCSRLKINTEKSKVIIFRSGGQLSQHDHFFFGNKLLNNENDFSYLGIVFSCSGKWSKAQSNLASQTCKAVYSLFRYVFHLYDSRPKFLCEQFDKLVTPILCEVWDFHNADAIERIQTKFCKRILHLGQSTSNLFIYGELGHLLLIVHRHF